MSGHIDLHSEISEFSLSQEHQIIEWLGKCIAEENKSSSRLTFIFCSDDYLLNLNRRYLDHNYYTDVITFDYSEGDVISGDIFISVERVDDNAISLEIDNESELHRVMIHGVLHLCGYQDKSESEKELMRKKEDYYLSLRSF